MASPTGSKQLCVGTLLRHVITMSIHCFTALVYCDTIDDVVIGANDGSRSEEGTVTLSDLPVGAFAAKGTMVAFPAGLVSLAGHQREFHSGDFLGNLSVPGGDGSDRRGCSGC